MAYERSRRTSRGNTFIIFTISLTRITTVPSRLWTLTNEPIANRCFESLDEVEEVLFQRCRQILARPDFVRGLTNFYWWSELGAKFMGD